MPGLEDPRCAKKKGKVSQAVLDETQNKLKALLE
jgi:hypothetical protein